MKAIKNINVKNYVTQKRVHGLLGMSLYLIGKAEIITGKYSSAWRRETPYDEASIKIMREVYIMIGLFVFRIIIEIFHSM